MVTILQIAQPHFVPSREPSGIGLHESSDFGQCLGADAQDRSPLSDGAPHLAAEALRNGRPLALADESLVSMPPRRASMGQVAASGDGGVRPVYLATEHGARSVTVPRDTSAVSDSPHSNSDASQADDARSPAGRGGGVPWPAGATLSEGMRAGTFPEGDPMDHEPASETPAPSVAAEQTPRRLIGVPPVPGEQPMHMAHVPPAWAGAIGGHMPHSDATGAERHERTLTDAGGPRDGAMGGVAGQPPDAAGPGRGLVMSLPQIDPQMPGRRQAVLRSLPIDPVDAVAKRPTAGQGPIARPELPSHVTEFTGLPMPGASGALPLASQSVTFARLPEPGQMPGQTLSHPGASRADGAGVQGASPSVQTTPAPVSLQIAEVIRQTDQRVVQIQLAPVELGRVRITLAASDAGMQVIIASERADTLDLLRRNASDLMLDLAKLGYKGVSLSFSNDEQRPDAQHNSPHAIRSPGVVADMTEPAIRTHASVAEHSTGMDLRM